MFSFVLENWSHKALSRLKEADEDLLRHVMAPVIRAKLLDPQAEWSATHSKYFKTDGGKVDKGKYKSTESEYCGYSGYDNAFYLFSYVIISDSGMLVLCKVTIRG